MSILVISDPVKDTSSFTSILKNSFSEKSPQFFGSDKASFELYEGNIDDSIFAKRESVVFIQAGIAEYENIPSLQQPKYDGTELRFKKGDLIFDGTEVTLTKLINSFLYTKKPNSSISGKDTEKTYIKPYGTKYPPVLIILFVKTLTAQISETITNAIGIDVFGRTHRKIYVVAIPILHHQQFYGENEQEVLSEHLFHLINLLRFNFQVKDVLTAFPGSQHFAQREQMDGDGDDEDLKYSLEKALEFSVEKGSNIQEELDLKIKEIETEIVGKPVIIKEIFGAQDEVNCTVYAPTKMAVGSEFLVQVFTHTYEQTFELDHIAKNADDTALKRGNLTLEEKLPFGTKIDFQLSISGLEIEEELLSTVWNGKIKSVQFAVKVPEKFTASNSVGKILVLHNSVPIGQIKFNIQIIKPESEFEKQYYSMARSFQNKASSLSKFEKAFISYASQDRSEVLKRVQMLNLVKLDFFQDLLTLEPGDEWESKIQNYIDTCDVFFIFWSKAASESKWVKKETLYALQIKNGSSDSRPEIIPVIIEGPPPATPPIELNFLHFNDKFIYFISST